MGEASARYAGAGSRYIAAFQGHAGPALLRLGLAMADVAWTPRRCRAPDRDRHRLRPRRHRLHPRRSSPRPLGALVPALGSAIAASPEELAVLVALQAGVPAEPQALAARPAQDLPGRAPQPEAIAATPRAGLAAWRGLGLV